MLRKPWPCLILAFFYGLLPFVGFAGFCSATGKNPAEVLQMLLDHTWLQRITPYFILCPVATIALGAVRRWSYPALATLGLLSSGMSVHALITVENKYSLVFEVIVTLLNIMLATYLSFPSVRAIYLDRRHRWWESQPRYKINIGAQIKRRSLSTLQACKLINLSEGGALVELRNLNLDLHEKMDLKFALLNTRVTLGAEVLHLSEEKNGAVIAGLTFERGTLANQQLDKILHTLEILNTDRYPSLPPAGIDFLKWVKELAETGEGLVPDISVREPKVTVKKSVNE